MIVGIRMVSAGVSGRASGGGKVKGVLQEGSTSDPNGAKKVGLKSQGVCEKMWTRMKRCANICKIET